MRVTECMCVNQVKLQSIFICIDCRSIFSNRDAYAFHMMTRAQNETCDVITAAAAAAAAAAELELSQNQNGDVTPSSSITYRQVLASPPPHGHRQPSVDARRALMDSTVKQPRPVSDRHPSARATLAHLGSRFDDDAVSRRWLAGRIRNGPHGRVAAVPLDKRSGTGSSSLVVDCSASGGGHLAPLNLTCQTTDRRSTTTTPHQTNLVVDACRSSSDKDADEWSLRRSLPDAAADCSAINGVTQRRSMSARSDVEERQTKIRRRTCWSVDNVSSNEPTFRPTLAKPAHDDLVLNRRRQSYRLPAVNSYQQKDVTPWSGTAAANSTDLLNYCNDIVTSTPLAPLAGHLSSSVGDQGNARLSEPVADRLMVDAACSRVHPPGHDVDLRPGGAGQDGTATECPVVAQEPGAADDDDDDALRQLLRLIQQPDGQPVFLCRHCDIIYADRMLYALHMGLHNVNNPWQCNICGTTCSGRQQFALHALHY